MVLLVAVLMLVVAAVPVMAQGDDKAARKAARQAAKAQKAPQAKDAPKKATPSTGGTPVVSVALLGVGTLLVGGGLVAARAARR
jgi:LPXTG-motif cell wall-anchored protein